MQNFAGGAAEPGTNRFAGGDLTPTQYLVLYKTARDIFVGGAEWIAGGSVREELGRGGMAEDLAQAVLESLTPKYLRSEGEAPHEAYSLSLLGCLSSGFADTFRFFALQVLNFLRAKWEEQADFESFTFAELKRYSELTERPLTDADLPRVRLTLSTLNVAGGVHDSEHSDSATFRTPENIGVLIECESADEFLEHHRLLEERFQQVLVEFMDPDSELAQEADRRVTIQLGSDSGPREKVLIQIRDSDGVLRSFETEASAEFLQHFERIAKETGAEVIRLGDGRGLLN